MILLPPDYSKAQARKNFLRPCPNVAIDDPRYYIAAHNCEFKLLIDPDDKLKYISDYMLELGAEAKSGSFYYAAEDFQGWHTNGDGPSQRVYLVWTDHANRSGMRFKINSEEIDSPDPGGWAIRAFTCPIWHCVYSHCNRVSQGFRFPKEKPICADFLQAKSINSLEDIRKALT